MSTADEILKKYWGYDQFRPLQPEIIESVLAGNDTIALLPTGGGKSICFQVPAMAIEGVCLVISPLIALMKDQVEQLTRRGIKAAALHSGMSSKELDVVLDNCAYGEIKFLYLSPERLKTKLLRARMEKIQVGLLAIDEAHCISQWGYDFRPPYLEIGDFREEFQISRAIALTATATNEVKKDIAEKLKFQDPKFFQKSFARANLSYSVIKTEAKLDKLNQILNNVPGTSVVYVGSRKRTKLISDQLRQRGIISDFYHAGLSPQDRERKQHDWISGKTRVIVSTNAFGMGIDKPDVRTVVHIDLPATLEAYYQEAGRAGRDEKKAYAVLLYHEQDLAELRERIGKSAIDLSLLKRVYQALANKYKLAIGSGADRSFDFNYQEFIDTFNLPAFETFHVLTKLDHEGIIKLEEGLSRDSTLMITVHKDDLYRFQVSHATLDPVIKGLLRLYGGELFSDFVKIREKELGRILNADAQKVRQEIEKLAELDVVEYHPASSSPRLSFILPRMDANSLPIDAQTIQWRNKVDLEKSEKMIWYAKNDHQCRTRMLQHYFGEETDRDCGICDYCVDKKKSGHVISASELLDLIPEEGIDKNRLVSRSKVSLDYFDAVLRQLVEDGKIEVRESLILRVGLQSERL